MHAATVWGWGEKFEDIGKNCQKYIEKKWKEGIKECKIEIMARERGDGICYWITAYLSNPQDVEKIAEDLFYTALFKGDSKVDFVNVYLFDSTVSDKVTCQRTIDEANNEFKKFIEEVAKRFRSNPKVEPIAKVKKVEFTIDVCLTCELESLVANKVVIDAVHWDFELLRDFVSSLSEDLTENGSTSRVLGYCLRTGSVDNLEVVDIDERREVAFVRLERTSQSIR